MFDPSLLPAGLLPSGDPEAAAIEDAGLNASQPPQQLLIDGWLLRFNPGKAKRARSVNALAPGRRPLAAKVDEALAWYRESGLPCLFRITPFSQPPELDRYLGQQRFSAGDESRVMTLPLDAMRLDPPHADARVLEVDPHTFAHHVGALRESTPAQIDAHARRLLAAALERSTSRLVALHPVSGLPLAAGQCVRQRHLAGIYDVITEPGHRRLGLASALVLTMLRHAAARGARVAYLQVDAANEPARRLYARLGFADRYAYWYRAAPGADAITP
ncbi:MAG TPA: GNAT family N-acetyltransferase [Burkholderiaceae bacterium]